MLAGQAHSARPSPFFGACLTAREGESHAQRHQPGLGVSFALLLALFAGPSVAQQAPPAPEAAPAIQCGGRTIRMRRGPADDPAEAQASRSHPQNAEAQDPKQVASARPTVDTRLSDEREQGPGLRHHEQQRQLTVPDASLPLWRVRTRRASLGARPFLATWSRFASSNVTRQRHRPRRCECAPLDRSERRRSCRRRSDPSPRRFEWPRRPCPLLHRQ